MNRLYNERYKSFDQYVSDQEIGFTKWDLTEGESLNRELIDHNHIFFILNGSVKISCNEFHDRIFKAGEMVFIPKSASFTGETLEASLIINHSFENPLNICDKAMMESLAPLSDTIAYRFQPLAIRPPLDHFLELFVSYLDDGVRCSHLFQAKQSEIFVFFRLYYTRLENATFFYPLIGKSVDFKSFVMANYLKVESIDEFARLGGYNVSTFRKKFKAHFNESAYQWILKQKSKHIKYKISIENVAFKDIMDEYGFATPAHFNEYCKTHFGMTPSQLRESLK